MPEFIRTCATLFDRRGNRWVTEREAAADYHFFPRFEIMESQPEEFSIINRGLDRLSNLTQLQRSKGLTSTGQSAGQVQEVRQEMRINKRTGAVKTVEFMVPIPRPQFGFAISRVIERFDPGDPDFDQFARAAKADHTGRIKASMKSLIRERPVVADDAKRRVNIILAGKRKQRCDVSKPTVTGAELPSGALKPNRVGKGLFS